MNEVCTIVTETFILKQQFSFRIWKIIIKNVCHCYNSHLASKHEKSAS